MTGWLQWQCQVVGGRCRALHSQSPGAPQFRSDGCRSWSSAPWQCENVKQLYWEVVYEPGQGPQPATLTLSLLVKQLYWEVVYMHLVTAHLAINSWGQYYVEMEHIMHTCTCLYAHVKADKKWWGPCWPVGHKEAAILVVSGSTGFALKLMWILGPLRWGHCHLWSRDCNPYTWLPSLHRKWHHHLDFRHQRDHISAPSILVSCLLSSNRLRWDWNWWALTHKVSIISHDHRGDTVPCRFYYGWYLFFRVIHRK